MPDDWKILGRRVVLQSGTFLTVEMHTVQLPNGRIIEDWSWVITPDFVNVVLLDADGQFVLFRQGKYAYEGLSLAPIGGLMEPGEDPLAAAQRETLEETGFTATTWIPLGSAVVDANRGCGTAHGFLALGGQPTQAPRADDLEAQEMLRLSRAEVQRALDESHFKVLSWSHFITKSLLWLLQNESG